MAKKRCFFTLDTEEEVVRWFDRAAAALESYVREAYPNAGWRDVQALGKYDRRLRTLSTLESMAESAEPGQMVVLNGEEYGLAYMLGLLPARIRRMGFRGLEEGTPSNFYDSEREIIPGVSEQTTVVTGMRRKKDKGSRGEVSRADVETVLRREIEKEG